MRWDQPERPQYLWKSGWWPRRGEGAVGSRRAVLGGPCAGGSRRRGLGGRGCGGPFLAWAKMGDCRVEGLPGVRVF